MAQCVKCGAETILLVEGVPICVACDETPNKKGTLILPKPPAKEKPKEPYPEKGTSKGA